MSVIAVTTEDYLRILEAAVSQGVVGGTIYDALLAGCAILAEADEIYTWNGRHYSQFGPEVVKRLRTP